MTNIRATGIVDSSSPIGPGTFVTARVVGGKLALERTDIYRSSS